MFILCFTYGNLTNKNTTNIGISQGPHSISICRILWKSGKADR